MRLKVRSAVGQAVGTVCMILIALVLGVLVIPIVECVKFVQRKLAKEYK